MIVTDHICWFHHVSSVRMFMESFVMDEVASLNFFFFFFLVSRAVEGTITINLDTLFCCFESLA